MPVAATRAAAVAVALTLCAFAPSAMARTSPRHKYHRTNHRKSVHRPVSACIAPGTRRPSWRSRFESGFRSWSNWTIPNAGTSLVTTARRVGIARAPRCAGKHVAEFEVTPGELRDGDVDSKLYEDWEVGRAHLSNDSGRQLARSTNRGAGIYSAWYYIPHHYVMRSDGVVNIFQFKESYSSDGVSYAGYGSDMQSSLNLFSRRGLRDFYFGHFSLHGARGLRSTYPMLAVNLWHDPRVHRRPGHKYQAIPAPLGRWFNITAKLYPGNRVSYYVDGKLVDTWYADEYSVGIRSVMPNGEIPFVWSFGVGHYGANVGRLYVADASYTKCH